MKISELLTSNDPEIFRLGIQSLSEDFYHWITKAQIKSPISSSNILVNAGYYISIFQSVLNAESIQFKTNTGLVEVWMKNNSIYTMAYKISYISIVQQYENFRSTRGR